jgi:acyl carrier protein/GNAT superfamily N-acetyltransferase
MTREQATLLVMKIVRERAFDGDEVRELPVEATLAELGFDSLALVSVISGLEAEIGKSFPDEYWESRQALRIQDLVEAARQVPSETEHQTDGGAAKRSSPSMAGTPPGRSLARTVLSTIARRTFSRLDVVIIERSLVDELPRPTIPAGIVLRRATMADEAALAGLWPPALRWHKLRQFRSWLAEGYTCLGAFEGERAVAVDWLNDTDTRGNVAGLEGTCLGTYLYERHDRSSQGIGLALLAYSLEVSRTAGYARQAGYVASDNTRMRLACTSLLGFSEVGSARRTTLFGRSRWSWRLGEAAGRGRIIWI